MSKIGRLPAATADREPDQSQQAQRGCRRFRYGALLRDGDRGDQISRSIGMRTRVVGQIMEVICADYIIVRYGINLNLAVGQGGESEVAISTRGIGIINVLELEGKLHRGLC